MTSDLWWPLAVGLLTPIAMIACHPVFLYQSRRPPNDWSGHRTARAASSQRNWTTAQTMCAKLWVRYGALFAVATLVGFGILYAAGTRAAETWWWAALVFAFAPLAGMIRTLVIVERALRELDAKSAPQRPGAV